MLLNILRGYSVQAALDAPRFCISAGLPNAEVKPQESTIVGDVNSEIYFETGIQDSVVAKLKGGIRLACSKYWANAIIGNVRNGA